MTKSTTNTLPKPDVAVLQRRIRVARGQEAGDLLLSGGRVVNVFTQEIHTADVVIADGWIAGVGPYDWQARETVSAEGCLILPGLIDAHMHLESTLLTPAELARLVVPRGTAAIIADPHEVGNVLGVRGIEMLLAASAELPLDIFFMAPSCVPAVHWEHAGAVLDADAIERLLQHDRVLGLAEMMDFPAVLNADAGPLEKIARTLARSAPVDGHAPGLVGRDLMTYVAAGIRSDHESTTVEEALAKASLGMLVQVREGSSARNLDALLPLLMEDRLGDWCLATDDVHPDDLVARGHIDHLLKRVVAAGVPVPRAVRHATLVPARHYGFQDRGAVAPGYRADILVVPDDGDFRPRVVVQRGAIVARDGDYLADVAAIPIPEENTIHLGDLSEANLRLPVQAGTYPVIEALAGQIVTRAATVELQPTGTHWAFDPQGELSLIAVIERHRGTGNVGLGLVRGFGFQRHGALGSSVAHDSHNLIIAGTNPADMLRCADALKRNGGGFVVAAEGRIEAELPLPIAGLLSPADAETICGQLHEVHQAARSLGCPLPSPFGTLSFLALPVIPELRMTDQGLFDVRTQTFVTWPV
jgi:adenine deaminase